MTTIDHAREAVAALDRAERHDALDQAGHLAAAQVHAILALVEQQRGVGLSTDGWDIIRGLASAPITASDEWPAPISIGTIRCPECAAAKHGNCDGTALDTATDKFVPCPCASIDHGRGGNRPPADHSADECSYELCTYCGCCAHGQASAKGCLVASAPAGMRCPNVDCGCEGQA